MTQEHPITPPPELVEQWMQDHSTKYDLARHAAQWGADTELEACCEWFVRDWTDVETADKLRAARRPKPPSLKEQAMIGLSRIESTGEFFSDGMKDLATIRRALEQLPDHE
jgi:hypothetical protein